jgi:hypothetical protein
LQYIPEGELKEDIEEVITYENDWIKPRRN